MTNVVMNSSFEHVERFEVILAYAFTRPGAFIFHFWMNVRRSDPNKKSGAGRALHFYTMLHISGVHIGQ